MRINQLCRTTGRLSVYPLHSSGCSACSTCRKERRIRELGVNHWKKPACFFDALSRCASLEFLHLYNVGLFDPNPQTMQQLLDSLPPSLLQIEVTTHSRILPAIQEVWRSALRRPNFLPRFRSIEFGKYVAMMDITEDLACPARITRLVFGPFDRCCNWR